MRKATRSMLVIALLLGVCCLRAAGAESANGAKRLAVVSLAAYDELLGSLELAGKLSGRPKLAKGLQGMVTVMTQGRGLAGLDTTRPWAIVIQADGASRGGYACLPVDDLESFLEVLDLYAEQIEDLGDGVHKVKGKRPHEVVYLKQKGKGWLLSISGRPVI